MISPSAASSSTPLAPQWGRSFVPVPVSLKALFYLKVDEKASGLRMGIPNPPCWREARWVIRLHTKFGGRDGNSTFQPLSGALSRVESGSEVWCPNSASTSVCDCSRSLCGHLWLSRQPQFFPLFLIQIIFRETCQGLMYLSDSFPSVKSWCVQLFQSPQTAELSWAPHRWGRTHCVTWEMADWAQQFEKFK